MQECLLIRDGLAHLPDVFTVSDMHVFIRYLYLLMFCLFCPSVFLSVFFVLRVRVIYNNLDFCCFIAMYRQSILHLVVNWKVVAINIWYFIAKILFKTPSLFVCDIK